MTPLIIATALSLLTLDAGQATSQPPPAARAVTTAQKSNANDDPDKVICHTQEVTGSRFTKRLCMTRAEWSEQERRTEEMERTLGEAAGRNAASATGGGMTNGGN